MLEMPLEPTAEMLAIIAYSEYPEDLHAGKRAQAAGQDVPPSCELEVAYGQYKRLLAEVAKHAKG